MRPHSVESDRYFVGVVAATYRSTVDWDKFRALNDLRSKSAESPLWIQVARLAIRTQHAEDRAEVLKECLYGEGADPEFKDLSNFLASKGIELNTHFPEFMGSVYLAGLADYG